MNSAGFESREGALLDVAASVSGVTISTNAGIVRAIASQAKDIMDTGRTPHFVWLSERARGILKRTLIAQTKESWRYKSMSPSAQRELLALYEKEGVAAVGPLLARPIEDALTVAPGGDIFVSVHDLSDPRVTTDVERPGVLPSINARLYSLQMTDEVVDAPVYHAPPTLLDFGDDAH